MNFRLTVSSSLVALAALAAPFAVSASEADVATPRIDQRQANQERRIDHGVASGALTAREAHRLQHQQVRIDRAENRAKADGDVTRRERAGLHLMQDRASRQIYRQKHDRQQRGG